MHTLYAWIAGTLLVGAGVVALWFNIHVTPLSECKDLNIEKDKQVKQVTDLMTEAYAKLYVAESNGSVQYINGIIIGVERDDKNITINFDNFYY